MSRIRQGYLTHSADPRRSRYPPGFLPPRAARIYGTGKGEEASTKRTGDVEWACIFICSRIFPRIRIRAGAPRACGEGEYSGTLRASESPPSLALSSRRAHPRDGVALPSNDGTLVTALQLARAAAYILPAPAWPHPRPTDSPWPWRQHRGIASSLASSFYAPAHIDRLPAYHCRRRRRRAPPRTASVLQMCTRRHEFHPRSAHRTRAPHAPCDSHGSSINGAHMTSPTAHTVASPPHPRAHTYLTYTRRCIHGAIGPTVSRTPHPATARPVLSSPASAARWAVVIVLTADGAPGTPLVCIPAMLHRTAARSPLSARVHKCQAPSTATGCRAAIDALVPGRHTRAASPQEWDVCATRLGVHRTHMHHISSPQGKEK
ncbi:hypothetical protein C8R47DRAFT_1209449 [Mycena vitilis]|nr:hypothetical protein C8R47DRAFT_1209449 [Mycena vitilis]